MLKRILPKVPTMSKEEIITEKNRDIMRTFYESHEVKTSVPWTKRWQNVINAKDPTKAIDPWKFKRLLNYIK